MAPDTVEAVKLKVEPAHTGPLLPAVGAEGLAFTVAAVVPAEDVQPLTVAVTLYVPVADVVALEIVGFWSADVKLLGPVHAYVAPDTVEAVKLKVEPAHTAPPLLAVGAEGMALTVTVFVVEETAEQTPLVTSVR